MDSAKSNFPTEKKVDDTKERSGSDRGQQTQTAISQINSNNWHLSKLAETFYWAEMWKCKSSELGLSRFRCRHFISGSGISCWIPKASLQLRRKILTPNNWAPSATERKNTFLTFIGVRQAKAEKFIESIFVIIYHFFVSFTHYRRPGIGEPDSKIAQRQIRITLMVYCYVQLAPSVVFTTFGCQQLWEKLLTEAHRVVHHGDGAEDFGGLDDCHEVFARWNLADLGEEADHGQQWK